MINEEAEATTNEMIPVITSEGYSLLRQRLLLFSRMLTWTDGTFISDVTSRCIAEEIIISKSVLFTTDHIMDKTSQSLSVSWKQFNVMSDIFGDREL